MEKPLKVKTCSQIFLLPISFLQNFFASQYSFLPPEWLFTRKKFSKNFAGKILSPKESAPPKHAPQNFLPRKFLSKKICSPNFHPKEFAPQFFPPKNLLPNIFALHISSHNEILLTKILQNIFAGEISSSQESLLQNLVPKISSKFALKRNCSPFCPPPPPPPPPPPQKKIFFFIQKNLLPKYFLPKFAAKHFCSPHYFSQKIASQILLPKNLCCPNHFVEQLLHLINKGAVAEYSAVPAALLLNICHLLKNCDWTEKTSGPSICSSKSSLDKLLGSRHPFTTASWFIVKFYNLIQAISLSHWQFMFTQ